MWLTARIYLSWIVPSTQTEQASTKRNSGELRESMNSLRPTSMTNAARDAKRYSGQEGLRD